MYGKVKLVVHTKYRKMLPGNGQREIENRMRAALVLCASSPQSTYSQHITLWSTAARSGLAIADVFDDSGDSLHELRRLIARREIDIVMTWCADNLSHALRDELLAAGCGLYSYEPGTPPPMQSPSRRTRPESFAPGRKASSAGRVSTVLRKMRSVPRSSRATASARLPARLASGLPWCSGFGPAWARLARLNPPAPAATKWDPVGWVPSRPAPTTGRRVRESASARSGAAAALARKPTPPG